MPNSASTSFCSPVIATSAPLSSVAAEKWASFEVFMSYTSDVVGSLRTRSA